VLSVTEVRARQEGRVRLRAQARKLGRVQPRRARLLRQQAGAADVI